MTSVVYWVADQDPPHELWRAVEAVVQENDARLVRSRPGDAVRPASDQSVTLVLLESGADGIETTGRRWRSLHPGARLLLVKAPTDHAASPGGEVVVGEVAALAPAVSRVLGEALRRRQLRTTLDRFNVRLQPPDAGGDVVEWRRLILSDRHLASVLRQSTAAVVALDASERVAVWNDGATAIFGHAEAEALGRPFDELAGEGWADVCAALRALPDSDPRVVRGEYAFSTLAGEQRVLDVSLGEVIENGRRAAISMVAVDVTDRHRAETARGEMIRSLQAALEEVKTLSGLLPVCASCKKIRDDRGYWQQMEAYISQHSGARFSHSMCPECSRAFLDDMDRTLGGES